METKNETRFEDREGMEAFRNSERLEKYLREGPNNSSASGTRKVEIWNRWRQFNRYVDSKYRPGVQADFNRRMEEAQNSDDELAWFYVLSTQGDYIPQCFNLPAKSLEDIYLKDIDFSKGEFSSTTFRNSDLRGANFASASLQNTLWDGADLREADFSSADLQGFVAFGDADIKGAKFDEWTFMGFPTRYEDISQYDKEHREGWYELMKGRKKSPTDIIEGDRTNKSAYTSLIRSFQEAEEDGVKGGND
jgi:hypothetical protein